MYSSLAAWFLPLEKDIRKRLAIYQSQTRPLVDFYQQLEGDKAPVYTHIVGVGSMDDIKAKVFSALSA